MIIHDFNSNFIDIGYIQIKWYSVAYILGIILGWLYAKNIIKNSINQNTASVSIASFDNSIFYIVLGIIIGGRLGYVFFYNFSYYLSNLIEIFQVWKGGMSFHGGLIGVIAGIFIFCKKNKLNFFTFTDLISCAAPIGIFLGRIANFINGELYGKVTTLPWAVIFPNIDNLGRHPSQIYEAIFEGLLLFLVINFLRLKKNLLLNSGSISSLFLIFYSVFRIIGEIFREPDKHIGLIYNLSSMGTLLSLITLIFGLVLFVKVNKKNG